VFQPRRAKPKVLGREAYLEAVRGWYDAGNRAVATELRPLSIDLLGDLALSRYVLRGEFNDGTAFVGRFASLARRHQGRRTLYRTSFSTVYRGPREVESLRHGSGPAKPANQNEPEDDINVAFVHIPPPRR